MIPSQVQNPLLQMVSIFKLIYLLFIFLKSLSAFSLLTLGLKRFISVNFWHGFFHLLKGEIIFFYFPQRSFIDDIDYDELDYDEDGELPTPNNTPTKIGMVIIYILTFQYKLKDFFYIVNVYPSWLL